MRSDDLLAELKQVFGQAKKIPLTDEVRVKPEPIRQLIQQIQEALASERR